MKSIIKLKLGFPHFDSNYNCKYCNTSHNSQFEQSFFLSAFVLLIKSHNNNNLNNYWNNGK